MPTPEPTPETVTDLHPEFTSLPQTLGNPLGIPTTPEPVAEPQPTPPVRTCKVEDVLDPRTLKFITDYPLNHTARALVLAKLSLQLPDEAKTFEQVKDYIEFHYHKPAAPPTPDKDVAYAEIGWTEQCSGTCEWRGAAHGSQTLAITPEDVDNIIEECLNEGRSLQESIDSLVADQADSSEADMELDYEHMSHDNHETTETGDTDYNVDNRNSVRNVIADWIRTNRPEQAIRLGL